MTVENYPGSFASSRKGERPRAFGLHDRLRASGIHLVVCLLVAASVLALVYLLWYPGPLADVSDVGKILPILLAVDVALGPILTFAVFDRRKRSLKADLACICVLQAVALLYGLYTVELGRPHYLVFVKDRFEVVSKADLRPEDDVAARGNPAAKSSWTGPRVIAAEMPATPEERNRILFEAVLGGRDVQHFPVLYRDYGTQAGTAAARARPLGELRALNPDLTSLLDDAVSRSGRPEASLGFLAVKGPAGDGSMLVDISSGEVVEMVGLRPWQ